MSRRPSRPRAPGRRRAWRECRGDEAFCAHLQQGVGAVIGSLGETAVERFARPSGAQTHPKTPHAAVVVEMKASGHTIEVDRPRRGRIQNPTPDVKISSSWSESCVLEACDGQRTPRAAGRSTGRSAASQLLRRGLSWHGAAVPSIGLVSSEVAVPAVLHLSLVVGAPLRDGGGERLGRVDDLIVRLGEAGYPPITGFLVSVAGRQSYVPAETDRRHHAAGRGRCARRGSICGRFERRPEEVLLAAGRARSPADQRRWRAAGACERDRARAGRGLVAGGRGRHRAARRGAPAAAQGARRAGSRPGGSWTGRASSRSSGTCRACACASRTRSSPGCIRRRSPTSSRPRRTGRARRSCEAVRGDDRELEADVFEELDDQHQVEFVARALRRGRRGRARADGARRRRRSRRRARRGAPRGGPGRCSRSASARRCARCSAMTRRRRAG